MKKIVVLFMMSLFLIPSVAFAIDKHLTSEKVEIVSPSEDRAIQTQGAGLIGAIVGARTTEVVFMVNALINKDPARLKCYENHRGCTALGPGMYDAEVDEKNGDVWISIVVPISHKIIRDHWRIAGTWAGEPPPVGAVVPVPTQAQATAQVTAVPIQPTPQAQAPPQQPGLVQPEIPPVVTAATPLPSAAPSPQQVEPATVNLKSTPSGADITIDGKFVGSTPSTVRLAPGDHEIVIQKSGSSAGKIPGGEVSLPTYRAWKRTLTLIPGGTITVDATLEPMR